MGTKTLVERRRALDYANRVADMATEAPDFTTKRAVYLAADQIRRQYGFSLAEKQEIVRRLVDIGCSTYYDLVREMKMPKVEVVEIVRQMSTGLIPELRLVKLISGKGRPTTHISKNPDFVTPKN